MREWKHTVKPVTPTVKVGRRLSSAEILEGLGEKI